MVGVVAVPVGADAATAITRAGLRFSTMVVGRRAAVGRADAHVGAQAFGSTTFRRAAVLVALAKASLALPRAEAIDPAPVGSAAILFTHGHARFALGPALARDPAGGPAEARDARAHLLTAQRATSPRPGRGAGRGRGVRRHLRGRFGGRGERCVFPSAIATTTRTRAEQGPQKDEPPRGGRGTERTVHDGRVVPRTQPSAKRSDPTPSSMPRATRRGRQLAPPRRRFRPVSAPCPAPKKTTTRT